MQRGTARGALQSNAGSRKASEYHRGLIFGEYRRYPPVAAASITSTAGSTFLPAAALATDSARGNTATPL